MFASSEFEDMIERFTLRFRKDKLESAFQKIKDNDFANSKSLTYLVSATYAIIVSISLIRTLATPYDASVPSTFRLILTDVFHYSSALIEFLIGVTGKFSCLRTVSLCITAFMGTALYSSSRDTNPTFRPG